MLGVGYAGWRVGWWRRDDCYDGGDCGRGGRGERAVSGDRGGCISVFEAWRSSGGDNWRYDSGNSSNEGRNRHPRCAGTIWVVGTNT